MHLRIEYEKGREVRHLPHLALVRAMERAMRRACLPVALTAGFNPHLKMSLGTVLPVGVWGRRELLDVELAEHVPVEEVVERLQKVMPPGLHVRRAAELAPGAPALQAAVNAAVYSLGVAEPCAEQEVARVVERVMAAERLEVLSRGKTARVKDLRPGISAMRLRRRAGVLRIEALVAAGDAGNVRADELELALRQAGLDCEVSDVCRAGVYALADGVTHSLLDGKRVDAWNDDWS